MIHNIIAGIFASISLLLFIIGLRSQPKLIDWFGWPIKTNFGRDIAWGIGGLSLAIAIMVFVLGFFS